MNLTEAAIDYLEAQIPALAETATRQAYLHALASGDPVLIAEDGHLVEVAPDGSRRVLKPLPPALKTRVGQRFNLKP